MSADNGNKNNSENNNNNNNANANNNNNNNNNNNTNTAVPRIYYQLGKSPAKGQPEPSAVISNVKCLRKTLNGKDT